MNFKNYAMIATAALALNYANPARADNASIESVSSRAISAGENLVLGVPKGIETTVRQYLTGNAVERVVLSHADGSGVIANHGTEVVRHSVVGLTDIPGAVFNKTSQVLGGNSFVPSVGPVVDGITNTIEGTASGVYNLLTGWARSK